MSDSPPEGQHDRSLARSAWISATPKEPSRRYGVIRAGVRTDLKIRRLEWGNFQHAPPILQLLNSCNS